MRNLLRLAFDVVAQVGCNVLGHTGVESLLSIKSRHRRRRDSIRRPMTVSCSYAAANARRTDAVVIVVVRAEPVWVGSSKAAAVGQTSMSAHVGVVGKALTANGARKLPGPRRRRCRSRPGRRRGRISQASGLSAVGFERRAVGVALSGRPAPVGVQVGARVTATQVDRQLRVGGEVARAERACAVRFRMLSPDVLLQVPGLRERAGTQGAGQARSTMDPLVTPSVGHRWKAFVAMVAHIRLGTCIVNHLVTDYKNKCFER